MKKIKDLFVYSFAISNLLLLNSCSSNIVRSYYVKYNISAEVETPTNNKINLGNKELYVIPAKTPAGDFFYKNNFFSIKINLIKNGFGILIENKSNNSIKINWDNSAIVDENNESLRVFHYGSILSERNKTQLPSIIVKNSNLNDVIASQDHVKKIFVGDYYDYEIGPIFISEIYHSDLNQLNEKVKENRPILKTKYNDKLMKLLLSFEIEEKKQDYIFLFKINDVDFDTSKVIESK